MIILSDLEKSFKLHLTAAWFLIKCVNIWQGEYFAENVQLLLPDTSTVCLRTLIILKRLSCHEFFEHFINLVVCLRECSADHIEIES